MKKILILVIVIGLLGMVGFTMAAKDRPNGRPFQAIWDVITGSSSQCSSECPQGPEGPEGPEGPQGEPGESDWDEERIAELEGRVAVLEARECLPETIRSCDSEDPGICSVGTQTCGEDWMWGDCLSNIEPDEQEEICDDELDNDCDGEVDEDC